MDVDRGAFVKENRKESGSEASADEGVSTACPECVDGIELVPKIVQSSASIITVRRRASTKYRSKIRTRTSSYQKPFRSAPVDHHHLSVGVCRGDTVAQLLLAGQAHRRGNADSGSK
jgi:hypothetical protein